MSKNYDLHDLFGVIMEHGKREYPAEKVLDTDDDGKFFSEPSKQVYVWNKRRFSIILPDNWPMMNGCVEDNKGDLVEYVEKVQVPYVEEITNEPPEALGV